MGEELPIVEDAFARRETQGQIELRRNLANATRDELLEMVIARQDGRHDWFDYYMAADHERKRLKNLLASEYHNDKSLRRAIHVADLEAKNKKLRETVRYMQVCAENHNRVAYATGLIVNCTGCEAGKPFNGEELTEERVKAVELIAIRLRSWFNNHKWKESRKENP